MTKRRHSIVIFKDVTVNNVIRTLVYSDLLLFSGWGFINPILAIFFTERIPGGNVEMVGAAIGLHFLVKSIVQLPVARYIDLEKGETDDFWVMILGSGIQSIVPFLYIFISQPWHLYGAQILFGVGAALSFPPWPAIFTRHIDKHEEGFEWSIYYSATDLGSAIAGALGGVIAIIFGYEVLMVIVGLFSIASTLALIKIKPDLKKTT